MSSILRPNDTKQAKAAELHADIERHRSHYHAHESNFESPTIIPTIKYPIQPMEELHEHKFPAIETHAQ